MVKVIFALIQILIAMALFVSYYSNGDVGSIVIACMLVVCVKMDYIIHLIDR